MLPTRISIIGNGSFGLFLRKEFSPYVEITEKAQIKILAVPFSAYPEIVKKTPMGMPPNHIVNVCSVQEELNLLLKENFQAPNFTGIHPMFGARSPKEGRTSVVTHTGNDTSREVINLFSKISEVYYLDAYTHDRFMAKTHVKVIEISEQIQKIVEEAKDIPGYLIPNSFKKLREFSQTFLDMPEGTRSSILSNKYKNIEEV